MSGQATGWALKHGPRPDHTDRNGVPYGQRARGMRAVLVTVADAANRDGEHAHPGIQAVCDGALYGRRQAGIILAELVADGWLDIEHEGGGAGKATVYCLPKMSVENRALSAQMADQEPRTLPAEPRTLTVKTAQSEAETAQSGVRTNGLPTESNGLKQRAGADDPDFCEFYESTYPRPEKRAAAFKAWGIARKKADAATIIVGARRYRDDRNRLSQFTAHPSTWLNNECWDDPPLPARTGQPARPDERIDNDRAGTSGRVTV